MSIPSACNCAWILVRIDRVCWRVSPRFSGSAGSSGEGVVPEMNTIRLPGGTDTLLEITAVGLATVRSISCASAPPAGEQRAKARAAIASLLCIRRSFAGGPVG
jgi:hypothetical protein